MNYFSLLGGKKIKKNEPPPKNLEIIEYNQEVLKVKFNGSENKYDWIAIYKENQVEWLKEKIKFTGYGFAVKNKPGSIPAVLWLYCNNSQESNSVISNGNLLFNSDSKHKQLDQVCTKHQIEIFPLANGFYKLYFFSNNSYKKYTQPITFEIKDKELIR
ncbi:hypothetical protein CPAV1605_1431 [seawater metagenome]|uniref:Uncharacterized protein n=1 Tax=seawater metagenome TaxID=1561972 RepID=A0A5E8CKE9_9ZZZZ